MRHSLKDLRIDRGWTHEEAAIQTGVSRSHYIKLERNERDFTEKTLLRFAKVFGVDPTSIVNDGKSSSPDRSAEIRPHGLLPHQSSRALPENEDLVDSPRRGFVRASYGGFVEAGAFRDVSEFEDDPDRPAIFERIDPDFPDAQVLVFDVAGDSMNALEPSPIGPGDTIVCLDFESLRGRVALNDGMVVVVEQVLTGGLHRERSVKQVLLKKDVVEFWPRSTNPRHKAIVIPRALDADDGRQVRILAIVRSTSQKIPLF